ncbi:MAG: histidine kinase [Candidatus Acidiferrales bacterium]|jgi:signal transduction histidine kinase
MPLDGTERLYLERQVTLGRVILVALSLVTLLETSGTSVHTASVAFLSVYLLVSLGTALADRFFGEARLRIPIFVDFLALAVFLFLTPSVSAFWFLFLFAVFAQANRGNTQAMLALVFTATAGIIFRVAIVDPFRWQSVWHWLAVGLGTIVSGLSMGFLGARERDHFKRQQFLDKITGQLQFDRGLTESVRQALGDLAGAFHCEQACLAVRDDEIERLFVWKVSSKDREPRAPEVLSLARCDTFLIDALEVSICWNFKNGGGEGFGWDRRTGRRFRTVPPPPDSTRDEFGAASLIAATIDAGGRPSGRILLSNPLASSASSAPFASCEPSVPASPQGVNGNRATKQDPPRRRFTEADLRWLEQIVRHLGPPLDNVFLMRNLRTHAVESERSRISRDLHDGILQTLLSLIIQLDVLRNRVVQDPEKARVEIGQLQKIVQQESEELRRMVSSMRPVRVESADMRELMQGFAERFRSEYGLAVDLFIEDRNRPLPDRLCRELFQIYRESLHNIKKHAHASHVVVKLTQDESKVFLVVDDNGRGFSFSGRYSSEELDRLRLGPISIKERTRGVGGTLTVESNPGHGARLTIDIPLN